MFNLKPIESGVERSAGVKFAAHDPFPGLDDLRKTRHLFETGQRVTVCQGAHTGRSGKIVTKFGDGQIHVLLDSGHHVRYSEHELEPEGFSTHGPKVSFGPAVSAKTTRVTKTDDPFGFLDAEADTRDLSKALESFAGTDGLRKALAADRVSSGDRALVSYAIERIAKGAFIMDPIPLGDDHIDGPHRDLAIMAEKYAAAAGSTFAKADGSFVDGLVSAIEQSTISADDRATVAAELDGFRKGYASSRAALERLAAKYSDRLEKRMRPGLKVGAKVRTLEGKLATVRSIIGDMVKIVFDDGSGEGSALLNATMEVLGEA